MLEKYCFCLRPYPSDTLPECTDHRVLFWFFSFFNLTNKELRALLIIISRFWIFVRQNCDLINIMRQLWKQLVEKKVSSQTKESNYFKYNLEDKLTDLMTKFVSKEVVFHLLVQIRKMMSEKHYKLCFLHKHFVLRRKMCRETSTFWFCERPYKKFLISSKLRKSSNRGWLY